MKYRIVKLPDAKYKVQKKGWFFWCDMIYAQRGSMILPQLFKTQEEAEQFIMDDYNKCTGNTIVKEMEL